MKIIGRIVNVLTTLIILIGGIFLVLYVCGITPYVVLSGSMEPDIKTGSLSFINVNAKYKTVKVNDVIAFKITDGTLVTHRVVSKTSEGLVTKGDANSENDGIITTGANYVGKNVLSIPKVGYIIKGVQSPKGKVIFATAIVLLFTAGLLLGESNKDNEYILALHELDLRTKKRGACDKDDDSKSKRKKKNIKK
mgnify:CR=1 FL=1